MSSNSGPSGNHISVRLDRRNRRPKTSLTMVRVHPRTIPIFHAISIGLCSTSLLERYCPSQNLRNFRQRVRWISNIEHSPDLLISQLEAA